MTPEVKKELIELAKSKGLNIAEDSVQDLSELALIVVEKLVASTENKYDDMIFAAVKGKVEELLADLVDKIDGEVG